MEKGLLFTYLMTYGGAVASLFNPFIGLLIYICFSIVKPESMWSWSVPAGNYSRIIAIGLLIGWAANGLGKWNFGRSRLILVALIGFLGFASASAVDSPDRDAAFKYIEHLAKVVLPFVVGLTLIDSIKQLRQLGWVITLSVGYVAFVENETYFRGYLIYRDNLLAHTLMVPVGLAFFMGQSAKHWWQGGLAYLSAALMVHGVLIHNSRGAMLGMLVIGILVFVFIPKKPWHLALFAAGLLAALMMAGPQVWERFDSSFAEKDVRDSSAQSRIDLWRDMFDALKKSPIFGIGPAHWRLIAHTYGWPHGKDGHGLWVQYACELGFPAGACILLFYGTTIFRAWPARAYWRAASPELRAYAAMAAASLPGFMIGSMFGSFSGMEVPYYIALLGAGAIKLRSIESTAETHAVKEPTVRAMGAMHPPPYGSLTS